MESTQHIHPMEGLKQKLKEITKVIPPGSNIYYVDYPVHGNCGDLLIMKGTEAFFKAYNIHVKARYSVIDFPDKLKVEKDDIFVLHGGGNFGDLYPIHQKLREKVVLEYPNNRVVILPQTIFYNSEAEYDKTAAIFNSHNDVHIYLRDTNIYETAIKKFHKCKVYLSPDMAHQLWPITYNQTPTKDVLYFFRTDVEKSAAQLSLELDHSKDNYDWGTLYSRTERKMISVISRLSRMNIPVSYLWIKYSDYLIHRAIKLFGSYHEIQTSRMHGHILSCLMSKKNVLLDNSYGKNSNYYKTWTSEVTSASLVKE